MAKNYAAINLMATTARGVEAFEIEDHSDASFENCFEDFLSCLRSMDDDEVRFYQILPAGTDGEWEELDAQYGIKTVAGPTASAVKSARVRAGLTQDQASRVIGATRRAWQEWEAGRRNMPSAKLELFLRKFQAGEVGAEYKVHLNSERGAVEATEIRYSDTERGIKQIAGRALKTWAMEAIFFRRLGFDEFGRPGYDRITF